MHKKITQKKEEKTCYQVITLGMGRDYMLSFTKPFMSRWVRMYGCVMLGENVYMCDAKEDAPFSS